MASVFDYICIGGGTAGIPIAVRLAEKTGASVLILEAGGDISADSSVRIPAPYVKNFGNPKMDWVIFSVPQTHAAGQKILLPRGKSLGGSSNLNAMQLNRSSCGEYDLFQKLGSNGWSWDELLPYFKKFERFSASPEELAASCVQIDNNVHGDSGPIDSTLPAVISPTHKVFFDALRELNVETNPDSCNGNNLGAWTSKCAIEPKGRTRVSADTAYLLPRKHLSNLKVISGAYVTKILFKSDAQGQVIAEGVEYVKDGETHKAVVTKEVILSAGAFKTPQLLEQSGIGNPAILSEFNIKTIVDLPGVGENLQDHSAITSSWKLKDGVDSWDTLMEPSLVAEEVKTFKTEHSGKLATIPYTFAYLTLDNILERKEKEVLKKKLTEVPNSNPFFKKMVDVQLDWFDKEAFIEIMECSLLVRSDVKEYKSGSGERHFTLLACGSHPLSRGSVHIQSSNPLENPAVDPNYFANDLDLDLLVTGFKYCRKIVEQDAFKKVVLEEVSPGPDVQSDDDIKSYIKRNVRTIFHPIGTAAMLPREHGGVVDEKLKVYGTANVRVMDASVLPMHISAHPMATIYAMAERAADVIAADYR